MIHSMTVVNHLGDSLEMVLTNPEESGFAITSISGIGAMKATINTTSLATNDGAAYNSSRGEVRNIVINLKYLWNPDIEYSRQISYKYFPTKQLVRLIFNMDHRSAYIDGYVESNEPDIFSERETGQISIICPDPYFRDYDFSGNNSVEFSIVEPLFEFAYLDEDVFPDGTPEEEKYIFENNTDDPEQPNKKMIRMSSVINEYEKDIYYKGDANSGMILTISITDVGVRNIILYSYIDREIMRIDTDKIATASGEALKAGDEIIISTIHGSKSAYLLRSGIYTNILNAIDRDSDWLVLKPGHNTIGYSADAGIEYLRFTASYDVLYLGV